MKAKAKNTEECTTLFEIQVPKDAIDKAFEEIYKEIVQVANIPGFRVGKAPIDLVKKQYAKDARSEVLKRVIPDSYRDALEEHKIDTIGLPEITDVNLGEDKILSYKAKVETRPKFKLKDYKGIKIEKKKLEIKQEDIDKTLENFREMSAKYTAVEDRPAQMGDYAVSDLECFVDGKPAHKKRESLWLFLEKESLIKGLSEKMTGMKPQEERDIEVTLPENYPDKKLAGKLAKYHVKVKELKMRVLPNVDDEFAKDLGKDNLVDLKKAVQEEMEARALANSEVDTENQLLNKLMDDNVFGVPPTFVKRQLDFMIEDAKKHLVAKGFSREELDKKDKEFAEKFKEEASRKVRLLFILDEIARAEKIEVTEKDIDDAYRSVAARAGKTEGEVREYYKKEDLVGNLEEKIRESKTIQFLLKNAEIAEK